MPTNPPCPLCLHPMAQWDEPSLPLPDEGLDHHWQPSVQTCTTRLCGRCLHLEREFDIGDPLDDRLTLTEQDEAIHL